MFNPIDKLENNTPDRYYEKIIQSIRAMMINGDLGIGGKLPSERELAKMFNVSRVPVREAIKVLEYLGVVKNIWGDGMYIYSIDLPNLIDKLDFALDISGDTINELFELRETIETVAAKLAATRRTEDDIQNLKASIDNMKLKILSGESVVETSHDFHNAVIKATNNKLLYNLYDTLNDFLKLSRNITLSKPERLEKTLEYHRKIFDKIVEQDSEGAMSIMYEHIHNIRSVFKETKI